jgi:hypothetical protein
MDEGIVDLNTGETVVDYLKPAVTPVTPDVVEAIERDGLTMEVDASAVGEALRKVGHPAAEEFEAPAKKSKKCSVCKKYKTWDKFGKNATHKDGHQSGCKKCQAEQKAARTAPVGGPLGTTPKGVGDTTGYGGELMEGGY